MLGDGHVRFGGRSAETERPKGRHRAAGRPYKLTERQQLKLARIQQVNQRLFRAYLLAQQLRLVYRQHGEHALALLEAWLQWARRCRLEPFVKLAKRITQQRQMVEAAIKHKLSQGRVEQMNAQIRLIMRRGYGFRSAWAVIALAMLSLGGLCPPLPSEGA